MDVLTIDFETYYDRGYSLSRMTMEEYIRDPRFEVIGVSVKVNQGKAVWCSGGKGAIVHFLGQYDWEASAALAHNAMFDMTIMAWHYGIRPKKIIDTLSMARALGHSSVSLKNLAQHFELGEKGTEVISALGVRRRHFLPSALDAYGMYCCKDSDLTYALFLCLLADFPKSELDLVDLTIRMFTEPTLQLDMAGLEAYRDSIAEEKARLLQNDTIAKADVMSGPKFAELLTSLGVNPPTKISPTTNKETWAFAKTDEKFKALLDHPDLIVQQLVAARLGLKSTIAETRTQRFLDIAKRAGQCFLDPVIPIPLRYYAAHTGRWGGDDKINMQNVPRGSALKRAIVAPPDCLVIDCDSSQIEARMLAWMAGQDDLVSAFEKGEDVYKDMAGDIYEIPLEDITKPQRFVGKTTILGAGYGMGGLKFQGALRNSTPSVIMDLESCEAIIATYRKKYTKIPALWRDAQRAVVAMSRNASVPLGPDGVLSVEGSKGIKLPNGLYLRYPNLVKVKEVDDDGDATGAVNYVYDSYKGKTVVPVKLYGGKLVENICQALARIVIGEQLILASKKLKIAMTVHDALTAVVHKDNADEMMAFMQATMKTRPSWAKGLPLSCEAKIGVSYGGV